MADDASISDTSTLQQQLENSKALQLHPEDYISLLRTLQTIAFPSGEPSKPRSLSSGAGSPTRPQHNADGVSPNQHAILHPTVPRSKRGTSASAGGANGNPSEDGNEMTTDSNTNDVQSFVDAVSRLLVREPEQTVAASLSLTRPRRDKKLLAELVVAQTNGDARSVRGQVRKVWRCMQDVSHAASCESGPRRSNTNKTSSSTGSVWSAKTAADYYLLEAITTYSIPKIMSEIEREWIRLRLLKKVLRKKYKNSKRRRRNGNNNDVFYDPTMATAGVVSGANMDEKLYDIVMTLCKGLKGCRGLYKQLKKKESDFSPSMFTSNKTDADDLMDNLCRSLLASFSNFERGIGELDANLSFRMFDGTGVDNSRTLAKLDAFSASLGFSITDYVMDVFTYWADFQILDVCATYQRGRLIKMIELDVSVYSSNLTTKTTTQKRPATAVTEKTMDIDTVQELLEDCNVSHPNVERITEMAVTHEHKNRRKVQKKTCGGRLHDIPNLMSNMPSSAYPSLGLSHAANDLCVCCRLFIDSFNRSGCYQSPYCSKTFAVHEPEPEEDLSTRLPTDWSFPVFSDSNVKERVGLEFVSSLRHKMQFYIFFIMQRERNLATGRPQTGKNDKRKSADRPALTMSIPPQALSRPNTGIKRRSTDLSMATTSAASEKKGRFSWIPGLKMSS